MGNQLLFKNFFYFPTDEKFILELDKIVYLKLRCMA